MAKGSAAINGPGNLFYFVVLLRIRGIALRRVGGPLASSPSALTPVSWQLVDHRLTFFRTYFLQGLPPLGAFIEGFIFDSA